MKKIVLKLDLCDDKAKKKALKTVSTIPGIDSISMDMKEKKLTVIGAVDAITIVTKLRKYWPNTDIISVGPAKEPEKPAEKKEEGAKAEEGKKEEGKKEGGEDGKKEEGKKEGAEDGKKEGGGDKKEEKKAVPAVVPVYDPMMWEMMKARGYNNVPPVLAYNHPQMTYYNPYVASYNSHMTSYGHPQMNTHYVHTQTMDENPNGTCTIS